MEKKNFCQIKKIFKNLKKKMVLPSKSEIVLIAKMF